MIKGTDIFSLQGKSVLLTGATGHLGPAMARILAEAGAMVYINGRDSSRVAQLVASLTAGGLTAKSAVFDVRSTEQVAAFAADLVGSPLHVLVFNSYAGSGGTVENATSSAYIDSYEASVVASHNLFRAVLPMMRKAVAESGDATVINLASMYALVSPDLRIYADPSGANPPFYGAAKAALLQWTRYAACEFGPEGIRFNAISPGPFPATQVQEERPEFVATLSNKVPLGRIGVANELRGPVLFLASSASSYVNGANLVVDGGWTCW